MMDPASISIGIGLAASLLLTELFGLTAGGMIVPGYLALVLDQPLVIASTLAAGIVTWLLARVISRYVIVYGRRRTALMLVLGFLIGGSIRAAMLLFATPDATGHPPVTELVIVGHIIPGLIAIWIDRQGAVETCCVVLTSSAIVRLILLTFSVELLS